MTTTNELVIMLLRACGPCSRQWIENELLTQDLAANKDNYKDLADIAIKSLLRSKTIVHDSGAYDIRYN